MRHLINLRQLAIGAVLLPACPLVEEGIGVAVVDRMTYVAGQFPNVVAVSFTSMMETSRVMISHARKHALSRSSTIFIERYLRHRLDALNSG
ncbi:hypothetical protein [Puniceibacterium sp. IMCC21224]|uniref:hypothetical protein n=1 Tax=Puniceibacterium sp. IMCC21224 TaxID=1618204 RepID=UPI00064D9767|nr:hypothetical protein [Puniceibacterium sp. IMCC21224]